MSTPADAVEFTAVLWAAPEGGFSALNPETGTTSEGETQYDEVWAAAGMWNDVFAIEPHQLVEASDGLITDLKRS